jgi:hypothetical protein
MKKVIFAAVVIFSMTTFAVNPVSVNPIIKLEFEKTPTKEVSSEKEEANLTCKAQWYSITCSNGNTARVNDSFSGACNQAASFCGGGWIMTGDN